MSRFRMLWLVLVAVAAFGIFVSRDAARGTAAETPASPEASGAQAASPEAVSRTSGGSGSLRVMVTAERDGSPVPQCRVDVVAFADPTGGRRSLGGVTDDRGVVTLGGVPAGPVRIFAADASRYWCLDPCQANDVELTVEDGDAMTILVSDAYGSAIPGADVWVSGPGSSDRGHVAGSTGEDGRLVVIHAGRGSRVAARSRTFGWSDRRALDPDDDARPAAHDVALVLTGPACAIRGSVTDESGRAVAGAWIACRRSGDAAPGPPVIEASTDGEGRFSAEGLVSGEWVVEAWSEDHAPTLQHVTAGPEASPVIAFRLASGVSIEGRVTDDAGRPLARVEVAALAPGFIGRVAHAMTSVDGRFRLDHLPDVVLAARAGYLAGDCVKASLDLRRSDRLDWSPVLPTGRILAGVVRDDRGGGRPFVRVRAQSIGERDGWVAESIADGSGRFEIANTPEGPFTVAIDVARWGDGGTWRLSGISPGQDPIVVVIPDSAQPTSFVAGTVASPEGSPLSGVVVTASRVPGASGEPSSSRSRDPGGSFRIGPLAPGDYVIEAVSGRGSRLMLAECSVPVDGEVDVGDCRIGREGFLKAFLRRDAAATGSQQLSVVDRWQRAVMRLRPVAGFATSGPLAPGRYVLKVGGTGVAPGDLAFEIKDGETTTVDVPIKGTK